MDDSDLKEAKLMLEYEFQSNCDPASSVSRLIFFPFLSNSGLGPNIRLKIDCDDLREVLMAVDFLISGMNFSLFKVVKLKSDLLASRALPSLWKDFCTNTE